MSNLIQDWRLYESRYNLVGSFCHNCKKQSFPKVKYCPKCGSKKVNDQRFEKEGAVYSFSRVFVSPERFSKQVPYIVALIKLKKGPIITSQIVDSNFSDIKVGSRVKAVFRKIHDQGKEEPITYGVKFKIF